MSSHQRVGEVLVVFLKHQRRHKGLVSLVKLGMTRWEGGDIKSEHCESIPDHQVNMTKQSTPYTHNKTEKEIEQCITAKIDRILNVMRRR